MSQVVVDSLRRVATRAALLIGFVGVIAVPALSPAEASGSPTDIIAFEIEGTGYGHGRGLSQWGAYGYAVDHGWTSDQILAHYYGGTNAGVTAANQRIKVRLLGYDGLGTVGVVSHGAGVRWNGHTAPAMRAVERSGQPGVFDVEKADRIACPSASGLSVPQFQVSFGSPDRDAVRQIQSFLDVYENDAIVVDGLWGPQTASMLSSWQRSEGLPVDGNNWNNDDWTRAVQIIGSASGPTWTALGTHTQAVGSPLRFVTVGGDSQTTSREQVLGVCSSSGRVTHYRGVIEVVDSSYGNRVVNDVLAEQYLRGVVPKEISASWAAAGGGAGVHSVRAQAVAARSYGLSESRTGDAYEYRSSNVQFATTCDSTSCQVYAGAATRSSATGTVTRVEQDATDAAILATANQVRKWPNGSIVRAEFSASNGPRTAGGQFPPVDDIGDDTSANPNHRWTRIMDADDFARQHGLGRITGVQMVEAASSTYRQFDGIWFNDVLVTGTSGTYRNDAWSFRNAYGLRSPGFTIRPITRSNLNTNMAFIGDSVGYSIANDGGSEFRRITDGTFASQIIDVVGGRCTTRTACLGESGVAVANSLPAGLDLVVVELGYNDTVSNFASDIDAMMAALQSRAVQQVLWVNMADIRTSGGRSVYGPANDALRAAQSRWPNLQVLDWDKASDTPERDRWFSDGVHLTATGQAEFALWIRKQLIEATPSHFLSPPRRIELPVVGAQLKSPSGVTLTVPNDATAVAMNVAVVNPIGRGFITVWPCNDERPLISSGNYRSDEVRSNSVIAPVSSDGTVCLYSSAGTDIAVDIAGWFGGDSDNTFVGIEPQRFVDTRNGTGGRSGKVAPANPVRIPIRGAVVTTTGGTTLSVPADADAVALNIAAVNPSAAGFITVWPCDAERPLAANANYRGSDVVSNGLIATIGADGAVCLYTLQPADIVVDVMGYVRNSGSTVFQPVVPTRLVDSRQSNQRFAAGGVIEIPVVGRSLTDPAGSPNGIAVPADATAIAINLAAVNPSAAGFFTVWPCGQSMPTSANINYRAGMTISNSAVAPIGPGGSICVFSRAAADVVIDTAGWFTANGFEPAVPNRVVDTRIALGPGTS